MTTLATSARPKRVTVFVGSGRKTRGATFAAARHLLDRLEATGDVQGEIVFLSEQELGLCRGCKRCFEAGHERCPLKGDLERLLEQMLASDGVIFATPNYSFQVSSTMKAFLDRLGFVLHRPRFHGRAFSELVVQGFYGGGRIQKYLRFVGSGLGFAVVKGSCITALEPMAEKERRKMHRALDQQARRLHRRLLAPAFPSPSLFELMVFRMSRTSIRQLLGEDNRDYVHYRDRGWFESPYYYPTRLGPLMRAAGALFDWVFSRIYRAQATAPAASTPSQSSELAAEGNEQ